MPSFMIAPNPIALKRCGSSGMSLAMRPFLQTRHSTNYVDTAFYVDIGITLEMRGDFAELFESPILITFDLERNGYSSTFLAG